MDPITSGQTSSNITLKDDFLRIYSGGVVDFTTVGNNGSMHISGGGIASNTTVNGGGSSSFMHVSSGGSAHLTTVNDSGNMYVLDDGRATIISIAGGNVYLNGGTAVSNTILNGGDLHVNQGGSANSNTVSAGGNMHVNSGGKATDIEIISGGTLNVNSNGSASNIMVSSGARLNLNTLGTAQNITENGGYVNLAGDGITYTFASNTISGLDLRNSMTVHKNTIAVSTTVNGGGLIDVFSGGIINNTLVNGGTVRIKTGASAGYIAPAAGGGDIGDGGEIGDGGDIADGEDISSAAITVNNGGYLYVSSGGYVTEIVENGGYVGIADGANVTFASHTIQGVNMGRGTSMTVHSNTTALLTVVNWSAYMHISSGGIANSTTISGGYGYVSSGGVANDTNLNSWADLYIYNGAVASNTTLNHSSSYMGVYGSAKDTVINAGGVGVSSGGVANNTIVNAVLALFLYDNTGFYIARGAIASNTVVNSGGEMLVRGVAVDTVLSGGAYMSIGSGGVHSGSLQVHSGATISVAEGGRIDFTLIGRTAEDGYIVNDYAFIQGSPTYTITVSADQAIGTYKLLGHVGDASKIKEVKVLCDSMVAYGVTLTINGGSKFANDGMSYELLWNEMDADITLVVKGETFVTPDTPETDKPTNVTFANGKVLYVSGGSVSNVTIGTSGFMHIQASSGVNGSADSTTLLESGTIYVSNGLLTNTTVSGGNLHVYPAGSVQSTVISSGGSVHLSGGKAETTTVSGGDIYIYSGGSADKTTLNANGDMHIYTGGVATNTTADANGTVFVSGGSADVIVVNSGGDIQIISGNVTNATLNSSAAMHVSGGAVDGTTVSGGAVFVSSGNVTNTTLDAQGTFNVYGGTVDTVTADGNISLSGGSVISASVNGNMNVAGGSAAKTTVNGSGTLNLIAGNVFETAVDGKMNVSGGKASDTTVNGSGVLDVFGGTVDGTDINGIMNVSGGSAVNTLVNLSGTMSVDGGNAVNTTVDGVLNLFRGNVTSATVNGVASIFGGSASETAVNGVLNVSGGVVDGTTINASGSVNAFGGVLSDTAVTSGGTLQLSSGSFHTGTLSIADGASVTAYEGSVIDFDLVNGFLSDDFIINDASLITGAPTYTVTISADQAIGTYKLAGNAALVNGVNITVMCENKEFPTITVNGERFTDPDEIYYKVFLGEDNNLYFDINGDDFITNGMVEPNRTVKNRKTLYVSGGTVNNTTVNSGGKLYIQDGGLANVTDVSGEMFIQSGGLANTTTVNSGATLDVQSGGVASGATVNAGAKVSVFDGGAINTAAINSNGSIDVQSGGNINNATVYSGGMLNVSGGTADNTIISSGGNAIVNSGGTAKNTRVNEGGSMVISSSGIADNVTVYASGSVVVSSGGTAEKININPDGEFRVSAGGVANNANIYLDGQMFVDSGAGASGATVHASAYMTVSSGGSASEIKENGGYVFVADGANVTFASHTVKKAVLDDVSMTVHKNTIAEGTVVNSGGNMHISSGGSSIEATVCEWGAMLLSSGGFAENTQINAGTLYADDAVVNGTVISGTRYSGGKMDVRGGEANDTVISANGKLFVSSEAQVNNTTVNDGYMNISGATANDTVVNSGFMNVSQGSVANDTIVNANGNMYIYDGAVAVDSVVTEGTMYISGGAATNTSVNKGGSVYIFDGGILNGTLEIEKGAKVYAYSGAVIDFTVAGMTPSNDYLIDNLGAVTGTPSYTITISGNQACGTYNLAQKAAKVSGELVLNTTSGSLGTITVNGDYVNYMDKKIRLSNVDGNLQLSVKSDIVDTNILNNGVSQILAWDAEQGKVGYIANDGSVPAKWRGVWEWSGAEADLWRVAGVGHFKGSEVDYDGVLLYNGVGNRFAAWTDLGKGSYGYVNLCKVDGSFNTQCLADLNGNEYDDILIYDTNGSIGVVLDGTTYKDIWHVNAGEQAKWTIEGAGSFDNGVDKLVMVNNEDSKVYLWTNNNTAFTSWNWSAESIGKLESGWEVAAVGDFEGDGIDDIMVLDRNTNNVWIWDDGNSQTKRWRGTLGEGFEIEASGDYNGDGCADLLLREHNTGWGGLGYWGNGYAGNWVDLGARIETDMKSSFDIIA